eukprot:TRINITY_DN5385_c0_g1_i1.p1 TRINITY_DN5385_c0_g1~~TRINITY_DN5385_c0_g1_i1.p1  ORF type:complete len:249 (-),score=42.63 TRINITY_DN5385_c0_g1_i1:956-1702(-)
MKTATWLGVEIECDDSAEWLSAQSVILQLLYPECPRVYRLVQHLSNKLPSCKTDLEIWKYGDDSGDASLCRFWSKKAVALIVANTNEHELPLTSLFWKKLKEEEPNLLPESHDRDPMMAGTTTLPPMNVYATPMFVQLPPVPAGNPYGEKNTMTQRDERRLTTTGALGWSVFSSKIPRIFRTVYPVVPLVQAIAIISQLFLLVKTLSMRRVRSIRFLRSRGGQMFSLSWRFIMAIIAIHKALKTLSGG